MIYGMCGWWIGPGGKAWTARGIAAKGGRSRGSAAEQFAVVMLLPLCVSLMEGELLVAAAS